jgi:hypothetical protein
MSDSTQWNPQSNLLDFNTAGEQRDVIPANTVCVLQLTIRPGGADQDGWFKRYQSGSQGLDCEYTVVGGDYEKRKVWENLVLMGETDGQMKMAESNRAKLRAMLESAYGIMPDDNSVAAQEARRPKSYADLNGLCFMARLGIEPASGSYPAKNKIDLVITPERKGWHKPEQIKSVTNTKPASDGNAAVAPAPTGVIARPKWGEPK